MLLTNGRFSVLCLFRSDSRHSGHEGNLQQPRYLAIAYFKYVGHFIGVTTKKAANLKVRSRGLVSNDAF